MKIFFLILIQLIGLPLLNTGNSQNNLLQQDAVFQTNYRFIKSQDLSTDSIQKKQLAITVDDLPFVANTHYSVKEQMDFNEAFLSALKKHSAPAIGFVNEGRLVVNGIEDSLLVSIVEKWVANGFELGNHTKDHIDYNKNSLEKYATNIIEGEIISNRILSEYGKKVKYFRHPYLHRGNSKEKVDSLMQFLKSINYIEAPVTYDNSDWIFSRAYDSVVKTNDKELLKRVTDEYLNYMESKLIYFEQQCDTLFKRQINQTLLLHINAINAVCLDPLLQMYKNHGYLFVTLDEALTDPIYSSPDNFYKSSGITWIHRWAITSKVSSKVFAGEPLTPPFILELAKVKEE